MSKTLVILAGGKGTRIKKYLKNYCKPMIKIGHLHFMDILLRQYSRNDLDTIVIVAGYRGNLIKEKYHNKLINFVKILVIVEKKPNGTWCAINKVKKLVNDDFYIANGDTFLEINLHDIEKKINTKSLINLVLVENKNYKTNNLLSNLKLKKNGHVVFSKKDNLMSSGLVLLSKKIFLYKTKRAKSFEKEILEPLIKKKMVYGVLSKNTFLDIGTPKNLQFAKKNLKSSLTRRAAFLDRDGVINEDYGYVHSMEKFRLKKGVLNGLRILQKKKYYIFIITNQAGIAKNKFSLQKYLNFSRDIKRFFIKKNIIIDDVEFCPYHKDAIIKRYKKQSHLRKPNNGMIENIFKNWLLLRSKSFFIGDQVTDFNAAKKSNLNFKYFDKSFFTTLKKLVI